MASWYLAWQLRFLMNNLNRIISDFSNLRDSAKVLNKRIGRHNFKSANSSRDMLTLTSLKTRRDYIQSCFTSYLFLTRGSNIYTFYSIIVL